MIAGPRVGAGARLRRWLKWLAWLVLAFMVVTWLPVLVLRFVPPVTSAYMIERKLSQAWHGNHDFTIRYRWVPWTKIAPVAPLAMVAGEDQTFPFNHGFDITSIKSAIDVAEAGGLEEVDLEAGRDGDDTATVARERERTVGKGGDQPAVTEVVAVDHVGTDRHRQRRGARADGVERHPHRPARRVVGPHGVGTRAGESDRVRHGRLLTSRSRR